MSTQFNNSSNASQSNAFDQGGTSLNNYTQVSSSKQLSTQSRASIKPSSQHQPKQKPPAASTKSAKTTIRQWFDNLPIARKQLLLAGASIISIAGLVGASGLVIANGLHDQILQQAKSENAVVDINYKIKINQMGFGFRGQADNTAIIQAATEAAKGNPINPALQNQVRNILKNEVSRRVMEYATLVDKNSRILVSANANRQGEVFNPDGLVTEVFRDTRQIKASAIVSAQELKKEAPPLPDGFDDPEALIRYTVTPVFDPVTREPIAALISGDIVNDKLPIVANTLKAFDGGYSALYMRQPNGGFALATGLHQTEGVSLDDAKKNNPLPDTSILAKAVETPGQAVAQEMKIDGNNYAVSALAIPNIYKEEATGPVPVQGRGEPVAILVRGTPETIVEAVLQNSLLTQLGLGVIIVGLNLALAWIIGRAIAKPIEGLQQTTQKFASGDRNSRADVSSTDEVGRLSNTFNQLADSILTNENALREEAAKLEQARQNTEQLAEQERQRTEALQRELMRFLANVEEASQGNLTVRADITTGEIGIVADMFNTVIESVRDLVGQVKQAALQVNNSVGKNETAIRRLSDEALSQSSQINQTLDSVEAMTRSIQQVAHNAQAAAEVARSASLTAQMSGEDMDMTVSSILQLRENISETAQKIKRLGDASQQIAKAVSLINQIAMQTNLLAVNASIEAARAGEEGQGFAVVATQVGQLAAQSSAATKEIQQIVDSIKQETSAAIKAMKASTDRVEEGSRMVEKAKQSLENIVEVSSEIDRLLQSISQETISQVNTSEMVTQLMEEVAQVSEKTSNSSLQVSSALQETVEITKQLQESVGVFKVA
jgi:twitching motility protein PilJ